MIRALEKFDDVTAAGILARAALAMEGNPAGSYRLPDELEVREQVISELCNTYGMETKDVSPQALERLSDILDIELDSLIGPRDSTEALKRLSGQGNLPSDLFEVSVVPQIAQFHGVKFEREQRLIRETVRSPDREQHYGETVAPDMPALVSLFAKHFPSEYPLRSFTMLVAGQRDGMKLSVHQAWRIYPDLIVSNDASTLVDLLHRFSDRFGFEITIGGKTGHFILTADLPKDMTDLEAEFEVKPGDLQPGKGHKRLTFSWFLHKQEDVIQAALLVSIDLDKYRAYLESRGY